MDISLIKNLFKIFYVYFHYHASPGFNFNQLDILMYYGFKNLECQDKKVIKWVLRLFQTIQRKIIKDLKKQVFDDVLK